MESTVGSETKTGGSYFTPLLLSLAGIVGTSIAIVAYHIILVKLCMRSRQRSRATTSQSRPIQLEGHQGVEENVLKAIPIYCYSTDNSELQLPVDQSECVICLGELQEGDRVRLLPNCGHLFHASCIDDWFLAHTSCPVCRAPIVAPIITPSSVRDDQSVNDVGESQNSVNDQFIVQQSDGHNFNGSGTSRHCSKNHLLGHSLSLVLLPREGQKSQRFMGLKRSLSMDQSYVIVDLQRDELRPDDHKASSSCTSNSSLKGTVLIKSGSFGARSMRQLDRMSSKLLRSFSQLRIGRGASDVILPY